MKIISARVVTTLVSPVVTISFTGIDLMRKENEISANDAEKSNEEPFHN